MRQMNGLAALVPVFFASLLGCGSAEDPAETVGSVSSELTVQSTPLGVSSEFMPINESPFPAGIAVGEDIVFIGDPFVGKVLAYSRATHALVGELPPPPQGLILPFILHSVKGENVAVLDAGGFPSPKPFVPATPTIYEYKFKFKNGAFTAELKRSISFASATIGFAEDAIQLDDGRYIVNDAILGQIWIANKDGSIQPGITPKTLDPADAIPQMYYCDTMPQVTVGGLPFLFTASTVPGISSMAQIDDTLYFTGSCAGAVYKVPIKTLTDRRQPWQRAADIKVVSPKPAGVQVEELLGLTANPFDSKDRYLYAADALQLRVIRIDPKNGKRAVVGDDQHLFNFPSSLAFGPPDCGSRKGAPLFTLSNQQHRLTILNDAIHEDVFEPPYLATVTYLK